MVADSGPCAVRHPRIPMSLSCEYIRQIARPRGLDTSTEDTWIASVQPEDRRAPWNWPVDS